MTAAVIVAGGQARRLGGEVKPHLVVEGRRVLDRQLAVLRELVDDIAISANDPEPFSDTGLPVLPDDEPGRGPLAGVIAALAWSPSERVLIVAGDMPDLDAALLRELLATPGAIVVPVVGGRPEPLHAVYERSVLPVARARLAAGQGALHGLLDAVTTVRVDCSGRIRSFTNLNSPEDLVRRGARIL